MFAIKPNRFSASAAILALLVASAIAAPATSYADDTPDLATPVDQQIANVPESEDTSEPEVGSEPAIAPDSTIEAEAKDVPETESAPSIEPAHEPESEAGAHSEPAAEQETMPAPAAEHEAELEADPDFKTEPSSTDKPETEPVIESGTEPGPGPDSIAPDNQVQTGWIMQDGTWFYLDESGVALTGEQCIDGQWYFLNPAQGGARATGFARVPIDSGSGSFKTAYYDADGARVTGTLVIDGQRYCFSGSGALTTGFVRDDNNSVRFYDPESGQMHTEAELYVHDAWRLFDESDGSMVCGEQCVDGEWCYYDEFDGARLSHDQLVDRVVSVAQSEVGTPEEIAAGYQDYITALGGSYCPYGPCMSFVLRCFQLAGMLSFPADGFVSCWPHDILDWQFAHGMVSTAPQIGSIAYFWMPDSFAAELGLSASHAELVVDLGPNCVVTIGVLGGVRYNVWYPGLAPTYYGVCIP